MRKNTFYLILKALFVLQILCFCPDILVMKKKGLIKAMAKSKIKFMTSQTGQHMINVTTILPNISISKSNQTMKFGQLM